MRSFAAHVRTVLSTLPQVDAVPEAIQLSHSSRQAQLLQRDYLDAFGKAGAQAVWSRALLGAISVLLCGYVAVLIYRLRAQTQRLARQLEFENILAEVRRRFVEGGEDMPAAFAHSVGLFATFFEARCHAFAVLNGEDFRVEHAYGNVDGPRLQSIAAAFGPRFAVTARRGGSDYLGFPYDGPGDPRRTWIRGVHEGSIVMGWFGERSISLFLIRRDLPGRSGDHEQRMYGNAALVLARRHDGPILVADRNAARAARVAEVTGARAVALDAGEIGAALGGVLPAAAIEATGSTAALGHLIGVLEGGGRVALVGIFHGTLDIDPNLLVERELTMIGCHAFTDELPAAVAQLAGLEADLVRLVDRQIGLDAVPDAYQRLIRGEASGLKTIIRPDGVPT